MWSRALHVVQAQAAQACSIGQPGLPVCTLQLRLRVQASSQQCGLPTLGPAALRQSAPLLKKLMPLPAASVGNPQQLPYCRRFGATLHSRCPQVGPTLTCWTLQATRLR